MQGFGLTILIRWFFWQGIGMNLVIGFSSGMDISKLVLEGVPLSHGGLNGGFIDVQVRVERKKDE